MDTWKQPGRLVVRGVAVASVAVLGAALLVGGTATTALADETVPVYTVTQEGLTHDEGAKLADTFGVPNALQSNGAFGFADSAKLGQVPTVATGRGRDEAGQKTTAQALDFAALEQLKPPSDEVALKQAARLLDVAGISRDLTAKPVVTHAALTISDKSGKVAREQALDTSVSFQFSLGGLPAAGQGLKLRLTLAPDGTVSQLTNSSRKLERSGDVAVISGDEALKRCAALYGDKVRQDAPDLGYQLPELTATGAGGKGTVRTIFPQYTCNPVAESGTLAHRLVPAVPDSAPTAKIEVTRSGDTIAGQSSVAGGSGPYTYHWLSSTTTLPADGTSGTTVSYRRQLRDAKADPTEQLTLEVTDANGLTATAAVELDADGTVSAGSVPGGGGYGALAVGPTDVGIEQTVNWQCAQDSANGFRNTMAGHSVPVAFDWRLNNAWKVDFKDQNQGGWDDSYIDNVDAAWYTGHGSPAGFSFINGDFITPSEARWGDRDLEWLQLESCQVLQNPASWLQSFQGLHQLNGFVTNAYCIGGGTGGTFANYLFPNTFLWWTLRPAFPVRSAWASMAVDKEPVGVTYRSMGLFGPGWTSNINDYFWGQGPVGPDIPLSNSNGYYWTVTGTV